MPVTNYYTVEGRIIGEETSGARTDYLSDALGSVTATVDQSAAVLSTYRYKPYGANLSGSGGGARPKFDWVGTHGYRNTGRAHSDKYVRARHYTSTQAAWTTTDPLWPAETPYSYPSAPIVLLDRSGLHACCDRTKGYCDAAVSSHMTCNYYALNCFCFVSKGVCGVVTASSAVINLICGQLGDSYGDEVKCTHAFKEMQAWADCINKSLYDCWSTGAGCSGAASSCWRIVHLNITSSCDKSMGSSHSCTHSKSKRVDLECRDTEADRECCCHEMVTCEQQQLTAAGQLPGGACYSKRKLSPAYHFYSTRFVRGRKITHADEMFEALAKLYKRPVFRFAGSETERIADAYDLCCKRGKKVWQGNDDWLSELADSCNITRKCK